MRKHTAIIMAIVLIGACGFAAFAMDPYQRDL
jgi:hypothetical protein